MGTAKVSIDFSTSKYSDGALSNKANAIADKMDNNVHFESPTPPTSILRAANADYIAALGRVEFGNREDTVIKNNFRANVVNLLKQMGNYVQTTSGGDEAAIMSSGFDVCKKPTQVGDLDKPENFNVKPGNNKGSVVLMCDVVECAAFYEFMYCELPLTDTSVWTVKTSTKRKLQIDNLTSGKQYVFRVAGAGSKPTRVWSEDVQTFVL